MQKALFGASVLAVYAALFSLSAHADETKDVAKSHDVPEIVEDAVAVSEASMLLTESSRAAKLLDKASRLVLAGPGDRGTAAMRREYASQLAEMADVIRKDTRNVTRSEAEYDRAISAYETDHSETILKLEATQATLEAFASTLQAKNQPDVLNEAAPLVTDAKAALETALVEGALWREVMVEIEFEEGALSKEVRTALGDRLKALNDTYNMRFEIEQKAEPTETLHLSGRALAKSGLSDVRSVVDSLFVTAEPDPESEEEPIAMPEPKFMAIVLD